MLLDLRGVSKKFGGLRAIHDVSFGVAKRRIFGLIGPNGAGKTTLFNVVSGVVRPDAGEVHFEGADLAKMKSAQIAAIGIARTFQNVRLFSELTVVENLLVASELGRETRTAAALLRTRAHDEEEIALRRRALEMLRVFELEKFADAKSTSLAYGSQRRLEIARAMMLAPKLLLLDEPAAGMNTKEGDELTTQIRWLRDTFDLTVMLVEHNMRVVMASCEEVHVLDHGETIAHGAPEEIRNDARVVASYLGKTADA